MDPLNLFPPIFEAKLELNGMELNFEPSIEQNIEGNFVSLIQGIMDDITHVATLIPKIFVENGHQDYKVCIHIYRVFTKNRYSDYELVQFHIKSNEKYK